MGVENSSSFQFQPGAPIVWQFGATRQIANAGVVISEVGSATYRRLGYLSLLQSNVWPAGLYIVDAPVGSVWRPHTFFVLPRFINAIGLVLYPQKDINISSSMFFIASFP